MGLRKRMVVKVVSTIIEEFSDCKNNCISEEELKKHLHNIHEKLKIEEKTVSIFKRWKLAALIKFMPLIISSVSEIIRNVNGRN